MAELDCKCANVIALSAQRDAALALADSYASAPPGPTQPTWLQIAREIRAALGVSE